ncbi:MAG: hypothetical protein WC310_05420 [Patescibacteria group bacterium]|jgi:UDPglucose 6-dehydrogenase
MNEGKPLIGFIGQGWIGRNYADDFEARGFETVRYALEEPYRQNKEKIRECDIVIIAVPTPTTPQGFDAGIVAQALDLVGESKVAVVKSTILPGTTARFQKEHPRIVILYAPEFLSEATAAHDAAHPFSNIIGLTVDDEAHRAAAQRILAVLPPAPFQHICSSTEAELIKYSHNMSGYMQIVLFNALYDLASSLNADWLKIQPALEADPYICNRYAKPLHKSGRGAGGGCFIKDFAALAGLYEQMVGDVAGTEFLKSAQKKNIDLLVKSGKDLDLLKGVYGEDIILNSKS